MPAPYIRRAGTDPDAQAYFASAGIGSGTVTPTSYDNAASFNGTSQYLSVTSNTTLYLGGTDFTFSAWVNLTSYAAGDRIIFAKSNASAGDYSFSILPTGELKFARYNGSWFVTNTTAKIPLNQWVHCAVTVSSLSLQFYINGTASGSAATLPSGVANQTTSDFSIGQYGNVAGNGLWLGLLSQCAIWKRALSATEITTLYNKGIGLTYSSIVSAGLTSNIQSYWALNQTSVTADSAGSNTLTNNGTVTATVLSPIATSTASARQLINSFVKQVKGLGLWSSMVCWPLRSSQNVGTLSAYNLGGLSSSTATLVSGLTAASWESKGIAIPNNVGWLTFPTMSDFSSGLFAGSVHLVNSVSAQNRGLSIESTVGSQVGGLWSPYSDGNIYFDCLTTGAGRINAPAAASANTFNMWSGSSNGTAAYLNTTLKASGGTPTSMSSIFDATKFGRQQNISVFSGTVSFVFIIRAASSATQVSSFYSVYKNTLGQGLSLP